MYISGNPLGDMGLLNLMEMVRRNDSLTLLNVCNCKLNVNGIERFATALQANSKIRLFNINENHIDITTYKIITAETDANDLLISNRTNPLSVDTKNLGTEVRLAYTYIFCVS